jgi:fructosamine-3-kinase
MEHLALGGRGGATGSAEAGRRLAALHHATRDTFGWERDNTIGLSAQSNPWTGDWAEFFRDQRFGYQLRLARENGLQGGALERLQRLLEAIPALLKGHSPKPSLLHGDLWTGNWSVDGAGRPVVFDPAVYYGDREADLAMTELFGGFDRDFYQAYNAAWTLAPGYDIRKQLYNLYHVLNHFNLFGGGYAARASALAEQLLSEL